ncbi:MAG TPA: ubiquinol-cytochrome c reductase iron-sulfur subunit, partial [Burkholderiales bacterium]|nr:ubiquinol-cytochrome c reductase iron-sulfur subunit [Burkholderiales bacterium]
MSTSKMDPARRNLLVASGAVSVVAGAAVAVPFAWSWWPSERAKAAGAPVEADISRLAPGEMQIVEWRGKPVWILRRTKEMLDAVKAADDKVADPNSEVDKQPDYAKNEFRSVKPEILVLVGICTHLGCSPQPKSAEAKGEMGADWGGGFLCPCHGSKFDLAGRVYKG